MCVCVCTHVNAHKGRGVLVPTGEQEGHEAWDGQGLEPCRTVKSLGAGDPTCRRPTAWLGFVGCAVPKMTEALLCRASALAVQSCSVRIPTLLAEACLHLMGCSPDVQRFSI